MNGKRHRQHRQLQLFAPAATSPQYPVLKGMLPDLAASHVFLSLASISESTKSPHPDPTYEKLELNPSVAHQFGQQLSDAVSTLIERVEGGDVIREYLGPASAGDDDILYLDLELEQHQRIANQLAPLENPIALSLYNGRPRFVSSLRYRTISIQPPSGRCYTACASQLRASQLDSSHAWPRILRPCRQFSSRL